MNLNTVDFEELLRIGAGKELYRGVEGRVLLEEERDGFCVLMSDILDGETLLKRLRALQLPPFSLATVKSADARRALEREYGFDGTTLQRQPTDGTGPERRHSADTAGLR